MDHLSVPLHGFHQQLRYPPHLVEHSKDATRNKSRQQLRKMYRFVAEGVLQCEHLHLEHFTSDGRIDLGMCPAGGIPAQICPQSES